MAKKLFYYDAISWRWIRYAWVYQSGVWEPLETISAFDGANWIESYPSPPGPLYNIIVTPSTVTLAENDTEQFTAAGFDADGLSVAISPSWSISTISDTITGGGLFTAGSSTGQCTVYATVGAIQGTATVTVT